MRQASSVYYPQRSGSQGLDGEDRYTVALTAYDSGLAATPAADGDK